jgi:hypothetical protein
MTKNTYTPVRAYTAINTQQAKCVQLRLIRVGILSEIRDKGLVSQLVPGVKNIDIMVDQSNLMAAKVMLGNNYLPSTHRIIPRTRSI